MDWAAMVMNMYRSWAQRRGYTITVVEEMPGEVAGIKVYLFLIDTFCSINDLFVTALLLFIYLLLETYPFLGYI